MLLLHGAPRRTGGFVDGVADFYRTLAGREGIHVCDDLMAKEIVVAPRLCAAPLGQPEDAAVKRAGGRQVVATAADMTAAASAISRNWSAAWAIRWRRASPLFIARSLISPAPAWAWTIISRSWAVRDSVSAASASL